MTTNALRRLPLYLVGFVRPLAVLDAIFLPGFLLYGVWSWPRGGMMISLVATLLVAWGIARASRAVFDYERYRWFGPRLGKWLLVGLLFVAVRWLLQL
jgi:hypothetical protein